PTSESISPSQARVTVHAFSSKRDSPDDYRRTLFPMSTNSYLIEHGQDEIREFLGRCLDQDQEAYSFRSQTRVYAGKPDLHLRRTVKLDPVAEFFIYDLVLRNRTRFRAPFGEHKKHFGYRFEEGEPLNPSGSFRGYKGAIAAYETNIVTA
ncbi:hypothetical protein, partial [Tateyamaria pelophila]|uniref:hypothetical protein n=1 Tax=Tateyamaria pelophila TaxID=328415 RepID=UPI001CBA8620